MTRLMEIPQIQSIIPHLIDGMRWEFFSTDLEFQYDYRCFNENDHIDSLSHARDESIEID